MSESMCEIQRSNEYFTLTYMTEITSHTLEITKLVELNCKKAFKSRLDIVCD
eukprot:TRINITY_DN1722_c0_g1_i1.p4 TRINITY_DN1722_c0_g1~~TRINITY_DN1722_c0_g1_i1.p4  ORF type:complete len:52 (+),score=6.66 TRINITY_DN1722_c0_g1_i1:250-405(+)